ncbi:hypothetical protein [Nocardia sp. NPDC051911]|uniref:hypothetical protein n=1 Tax=Nocardia TaxID=1817 RepID=UPI003433D206
MVKTAHAVEDGAASARGERADLAAWRRRDALRRGNAARPIPSKRQYRRRDKHRKTAAEG